MLEMCIRDRTFGGSLARTQATGYGLCYFTAEALKCMRSDSFQGKTVVISGSGNVAIYACEKATPVSYTHLDVYKRQ